MAANYERGQACSGRVSRGFAAEEYETIEGELVPIPVQ
jgi:hypothetical protein